MNWLRFLGVLAVLGIAVGTVGGLVAFITRTATATAYGPTAAMAATAIAVGVVVLAVLVGLRGAPRGWTPYW